MTVLTWTLIVDTLASGDNFTVVGALSLIMRAVVHFGLQDVMGCAAEHMETARLRLSRVYMERSII